VVDEAKRIGGMREIVATRGFQRKIRGWMRRRKWKKSGK
jgi:hypothetical protein